MPVAGGTLVRRISIYWHRDRYRSRAGETFVEIAREVGAEILEQPVA